MKITKVKYGKLVSRDDFSNERIEVEAEVEVEGTENADNVLSQLKEYVHKKLEVDSIDEKNKTLKRIKSFIEDIEQEPPF